MKNENLIFLRQRIQLNALAKTIGCDACGIKERDYVQSSVRPKKGRKSTYGKTSSLRHSEFKTAVVNNSRH